MNFLLDTHVWIWSLTASLKLNLQTQQALNDLENNFYLSPITVWETILLIEKQKLPVNLPGPDWVRQSLGQFFVIEAPLTNAVAIRSRQVDLPHQDPANRFIAATAIEYNLTLMTADQNLLSSKQLATWQVI